MTSSNQTDLLNQLRNAGLRPTQQRVAIAETLFEKGHRHVSAEMVFDEMQQGSTKISLATIYNTLNQFKEVGLLRQIAIDSNKSYFDTNTGPHHHYYYENESKLVDIPQDSICVSGLPDIPEGMEIDHIDVVVRLKPIDKKS